LESTWHGNLDFVIDFYHSFESHANPSRKWRKHISIACLESVISKKLWFSSHGHALVTFLNEVLLSIKDLDDFNPEARSLATA
jgi:hypothetical protein